MATSVDQALEELYAGSPAAFTSTRDRLAKELRASGDTEGAAAVAARHRPTQIAHVLNQLARRDAHALAELVDVGRELARVQRGVLRGGSASGLREAIDRQRKVVADLTSKAAGVMRDLGIDPHDHLDAIATALHTALVDPAVGDALERGQLEKAPSAAAGFPGATATATEDAHAPTHAERDLAERRRDSARRAARERRERAAEERRRKAVERESAKRRATEKRALDARARDEAKRRAEGERRAEAVAAAAAAEREAKTAFAAASTRADEAARARKEAARLAKEARALAADAKRLAAASKRATARARALGARTSS